MLQLIRCAFIRHSFVCYSDRWNRRHTWERPIVLVGHSLGCVMIEHLVVALDRRTRSLETVEDEVEIGQARVAQAFLTSLAGCFFYAPPWTGLVPSEDLLKHVFGGLSYSRELFSDLCLDSPKLKLLSEDFMRAQTKYMKLTALIEGCHTKGVSLSLHVEKTTERIIMHNVVPVVKGTVRGLERWVCWLA